MESFLMRAQAQRAVIQEEDPTFAGGDRFLVGYILDHAELTLKDGVMVLCIGSESEVLLECRSSTEAHGTLVLGISSEVASRTGSGT